MNSSYSLQLIRTLDDRQLTQIFGYSILYLPDFLGDHTLLSQTDTEKLAEVLGRFERFVAGLRKYRGVAYSLRFITHPQDGAIQVCMLGRLLTAEGGTRAITLAEQVRADLGVHLTSYGFTHLPLQVLSYRDQITRLEIASITQVLQPFGNSFTIAELRQHEALTLLMTVNKEAYTIHPYWGAAGACLEPFESLLRQQAPVVLSIYLEPSEVTQSEADALDEAAHIAQTLSDADVKTYSDTSVRRRRDPGAELVGKLYSAYHKSLVEPFIAFVQVASPDPNAAWTVARSYASAVVARNQHDPIQAAERDLPSQADLVLPSNGDELASARLAFENLLHKTLGTVSGLTR